MSLKSHFSFRQRTGKINWKLVSSTSLQSIIEKQKVNELQIILDTIVFSEFDSNDVKAIPIECTSKLINVMQLL